MNNFAYGTKMTVEKNDVKEAFKTVVERFLMMNGLKVNREAFLRDAFSEYPELMGRIIAEGPQEVFDIEDLRRKASEVIDKDALGTSIISGITGLTSIIGLSLVGVGVDEVQSTAYIVRLAQKIAYLFGEDDFRKLPDVQSQCHILLLLGAMYGVDCATELLEKGIIVGGKKLGAALSKKALKKAGTEQLMQRILNEIAGRIGKQALESYVSKGFVVVGSAVSGAATWMSFRPLGEHLADVYLAAYKKKRNPLRRMKLKKDSRIPVASSRLSEAS